MELVGPRKSGVSTCPLTTLDFYPQAEAVARLHQLQVAGRAGIIMQDSDDEDEEEEEDYVEDEDFGDDDGKLEPIGEEGEEHGGVEEGSDFSSTGRPSPGSDADSGGRDSLGSLSSAQHSPVAQSPRLSRGESEDDGEGNERGGPGSRKATSDARSPTSGNPPATVASFGKSTVIAAPISVTAAAATKSFVRSDSNDSMDSMDRSLALLKAAGSKSFGKDASGGSFHAPRVPPPRETTESMVSVGSPVGVSGRPLGEGVEDSSSPLASGLQTVEPNRTVDTASSSSCSSFSGGASSGEGWGGPRGGKASGEGWGRPRGKASVGRTLAGKMWMERLAAQAAARQGCRYKGTADEAGSTARRRAVSSRPMGEAVEIECADANGVKGAGGSSIMMTTSAAARGEGLERLEEGLLGGIGAEGSGNLRPSDDDTAYSSPAGGHGSAMGCPDGLEFDRIPVPPSQPSMQGLGAGTGAGDQLSQAISLSRTSGASIGTALIHLDGARSTRGGGLQRPMTPSRLSAALPPVPELTASPITSPAFGRGDQSTAAQSKSASGQPRAGADSAMGGGSSGRGLGVVSGTSPDSSVQKGSRNTKIGRISAEKSIATAPRGAGVAPVDPDVLAKGGQLDMPPPHLAAARGSLTGDQGSGTLAPPASTLGMRGSQEMIPGPDGTFVGAKAGKGIRRGISMSNLDPAAKEGARTEVEAAQMWGRQAAAAAAAAGAGGGMAGGAAAALAAANASSSGGPLPAASMGAGYQRRRSMVMAKQGSQETPASVYQEMAMMQVSGSVSYGNHEP